MTRRSLTRRRRDGAMLLLVAVSLVGALALVSLAVDGGMLQSERRAIQSAADAGALAAAVEMFRARPESVSAAVQSETSRNGYSNGVNSVAVVDTTPTTGGAYVGSSFVKVDVTKTVSTFFAAIINRPTVTVHAQAVAGLGPATETCIVLTDTTGVSLSLQSAAQDTAASCNINVNSVSSPAVTVSNTSTKLVASYINVTGTTSTASGGAITGTISTGSPPVPDPLGYLTFPTFSKVCDAAHTNVQVKSGAQTTLSPGVYCGGLSVQNNGSVATLSEGTYILIGKQGTSVLSVQSGATLQSSGDGVTIIIGGNASNQYGTVNLQSGSTILLSADTDPLTTDYPGILFYMDPAAPRGTQVIQSQAGATINGTLYFPNQLVRMESAGLLTVNGALVAGALTTQSAGSVKFTGYAGGSAYFGLKKVSLVQ